MSRSSLIIALAGALPGMGASLSIDAQNTFAGASNPFTDNGGAPLTSSNLVQFGYFLVADAPDSESDSFASFNVIASVMIDLGLDGTFAQTVDLDNTTDVPPGTPPTLRYGIRFFDGADEGSSTFYNTVTNQSWEFAFSDASPPPTNSSMFLDPILGTSTVDSAIWEGGSASAFSTTVPIPEPSTSLTALLGCALVIGRRRRV